MLFHITALGCLEAFMFMSLSFCRSGNRLLGLIVSCKEACRDGLPSLLAGALVLLDLVLVFASLSSS